MKRFLDAPRVLIATSVVLAAALAFLLFQRFRAAPPAPPAPAPAAAHAEPPKAAEPGHESAKPAAEPAHAAAAPGKPAEEPAHAAADPAKPAAGPAEPAKPAAAPAPAEAAPARPAAPEPAPRARKREPAAVAEAAAAAIFSDRPAGDGEGGRQRTPRIPVLRKPPAGVAPAAYAAAVPHPVPARTSAPAARAAAAPHGPSPAAAPAAASGQAAAPLPGPTPYPSQARAASGGQPLPGAVSGTLRGAGNAPIAGVPVLALAAGGDDAFETITDDDGFYLLSGMRPGRYLVFTGLGARPAPALPARAVEIRDGRVARLDLREPGAGTTVRVRPLRADGGPLPGQVLLVAGPPPSPATLQGLLRSDAVFLPEAGGQRVLRRVPAGVYTLVVLQADATLRVAKQPVAVRGDGEQVLEARFPPDTAGALGG